MILNIQDQSAVVLYVKWFEGVTNEVLRAFEGKSTDQDEKEEYGNSEPLMFGFFAKKSPPSTGHAVRWVHQSMKALLMCNPPFVDMHVGLSHAEI